MTEPRLKVLAIAEAANPEWVSVPLVGWSMARALAGVADVHLVTQVRNREAILRAGLVEGRDFTAIDSEAVAERMHRLSTILRMGEGRGWTMKTALEGLAYPYFEHLVWKRFGAEIAAGAYDVVHRITPLSPTIPSGLAPKVAATGTPFVLGPLNGGVPWPRGFDAERRREREWLSYVRSAYKLRPGRLRTLGAAAAIFAGSRYTASEIPARFRHKTVWLPENAIDPARFDRIAAQATALPLRGCFLGRLVPYKGCDMLIEAATELLRGGRLVLDIVGDGPMRADLEQQVAEAGLREAVTFHGQVPHQEVKTILSRANLLTFPSIREFGGGVVLEAMATGVVPLVVDYAGPGELVTSDTAITVPIGPRDQIVADLRAALEEVAARPERLGPMAKAARRRAQTLFTWDAKARQVAEVYDKVTGRRADWPDPIGRSDKFEQSKQ
ncbi:glycosyltransferase [uncultured Jannaschia sp.]|uniref:glycosyltransferase family 4 protein n=1 Tax=uncultured Jannaschia sp. TaxID=293347 RepID=UPI002625F9BF|nr:glycosyltransferase [uncultured Jannaschia sp.]